MHVCCGPCSIHPLIALKEEGYDVTGFFYNPNIHPEEEFKRRRDAISNFADKHSFNVLYFDYLPEDFFTKVSPALQKPERCLGCWELRLRKAALFAREHKFDNFTTTLLISPYQDQLKIREIGEYVAREEGMGFFYRDFREGFRDSQNKARELGLYRQRYCGCIYSKIEREEVTGARGIKSKL